MNEPDSPIAMPTRLEQEAYGWVVRFVSGEAGPDDIKALKEWSAQSLAHAAAFDQASKVWQAAHPAVQRLSATRASPGLRGSGANANNVSQGRAVLGRRAVLGGALAASAAGLAFMTAHPPLGLWPSWSELTADYRTQTGQQRQITLPGDVAIDMNTQTSIDLRSANRAGRRIELVVGEAVISAPAAASSRLTVVAADGRVIAADARFNLRRDDRIVSVTCVSGVVTVECGPAQVQLAAGKQVTYSDQGLGQPVTVDPAIVTAWQGGIVIFDATPLTQVIEEINRYRSGRVILTSVALGRERFSARFQIANIDGVVEQIARVFGAQITTLPGGIVLLG